MRKKRGSGIRNYSLVEMKFRRDKKKGFGANGGFGGTKEKRELIVKNYEKKEGVWAQQWI